MTRKPLVSVLMPFYDSGQPVAQRQFSQAVESILTQTFQDFEIVAVVSGEEAFARKLAAKSGKIRLVTFRQKPIGQNRPLSERLEGIVNARNLCIKNARAQLVAYADYDDISMPGRLRAQYDFLMMHPGVGAVGSNMLLINADGKIVGARKAFENDAEIRRHFLQFNPVPQPTLMARKSLIVEAGAYAKGEFAEDYDLWVRMAKIAKFHNLQAQLVKYRVHSGGGATAYKFPLYFSSLRVKVKAAKTLGIAPRPMDIVVNAMQFLSLFFPDSIRRTVLERARSKLVVGS